MEGAKRVKIPPKVSASKCRKSKPAGKRRSPGVNDSSGAVGKTKARVANLSTAAKAVTGCVSGLMSPKGRNYIIRRKAMTTLMQWAMWVAASNFFNRFEGRKQTWQIYDALYNRWAYRPGNGDFVEKIWRQL
jgi:hypothetical protein